MLLLRGGEVAVRILAALSLVWEVTEEQGQFSGALLCVCGMLSVGCPSEAW